MRHTRYFLRSAAACAVCLALLLVSACGKKPEDPASDPQSSVTSGTDSSGEPAGSDPIGDESSSPESTNPDDPASSGGGTGPTGTRPPSSNPDTPPALRRGRALDTIGGAAARSTAPSSGRWISRTAIPSVCRATAICGRGPGRTTIISTRPTAMAGDSAAYPATSRWAA